MARGRRARAVQFAAMKRAIILQVRPAVIGGRLMNQMVNRTFDFKIP
jgi:hypothetical protein